MAQRLHRWWGVGCVSVDGSQELAKRGGRGLLAGFRGSLPPASDREARMDDPTLRCENDTGNEMHLSGLPIPSGGPIFCLYFYARPRLLLALPNDIAIGVVPETTLDKFFKR